MERREGEGMGKGWQGKGLMGAEVEGEAVDRAWPDLWLSLRDATAAASGAIRS